MPTAHSDIGASQLVHSIIPDSENRPRGDFYRTPECATQALLSVETFDGIIWEPACGDGAISEVLIEAGYDVFSSDLYDRGYGIPGINFISQLLNNELEHKYDNVVTNPPFTDIQEFVEKALEVSTKKVAILARLLWLEGADRHRTLFRQHPPSRVWVFSYRINVSRDGADYGDGGRGGMVAFAWYVWDKADASGETKLGWLT